MDTRKDDKEAKKFAKNLELAELMEYLNTYLNKNEMPNAGSAKKHLMMRETIQADFNKKNKKQQIIANAGNNNMVFILNNIQFVILISEIRQTAADIDKIFSPTTSTWLPKEYKIDPLKKGPLYNKKSEINFGRENNPKFNRFKEGELAGNFVSVSVTEYFPTSLHALTKSENSSLSDDERINLACDMYQQINAVFLDLEKHQYLWSDLKPGNIMIRNDGSIGIPDKKAFMSYQDVLVKAKAPNAYLLKPVKNKNNFGEIVNEFYYEIPKDNNSPLAFSVKHENGETIKGEISVEALKRQFVSDEEYLSFRDYINDNRSLERDSSKVSIFEATASEHGTLPIEFAANWANYTSPAFISAEFKKEQRYDSPYRARTAFIENMHKEYSFQLAAILYVTLTGDENKFADLMDGKPLDFSKPIFKTSDGIKLQDLILRLSDPDPEKRFSHKRGLMEVNEIRAPKINKEKSKRSQEGIRFANKESNLKKSSTKTLIKEQNLALKLSNSKIITPRKP